MSEYRYGVYIWKRGPIGNICARQEQKGLCSNILNEPCEQGSCPDVKFHKKVFSCALNVHQCEPVMGGIFPADGGHSLAIEGE